MSRVKHWLHVRWLYLSVMAVTLFWWIKVFADAPNDPAQDNISLIDQLWQAVVSKKWGLAAVIGTMLFVAFVRFVAPRIHGGFGSWVQSQRVSAALALVGGMMSAMATQLMQGGHLSIKMLAWGFSIGVGAIGGYNAFWDIIFPADKKGTPRPDVASPIIIDPK